MSNIQDQKVIPPEILTKLQDNKTYLALYLLHREEFIKSLNDIVALNYSSAFTKLVKRMLRLASDKQNVNYKKMCSMHKKLLKYYTNSFSRKNHFVYRCHGASLSEQDNIRLPFVDCILDFSKSGKSKQVVPCMLDTGSQISVCSYN